jgi:hypothetical protein
MSEKNCVSFAGKSLPVHALPLGKVLQLLLASNRLRERFATGTFDLAATEDMILIVSLGTGIDMAELDKMPGTLLELESAMETVMQVAGLVSAKNAEGASTGEALQPATTQSAGLTTSTPT